MKAEIEIGPNGVYDLGDVSKTSREKGKSIIDFPEEYVVLDLETTGLDPKYDSIIEIAAVRYKEDKRVAEFNTLVKPSKYFLLDENDDDMDFIIRDGYKISYLSNFIKELTGISNIELDSAPDESSVITDVYDFIGDSVVVGHKVNFDINFLYDALLKHQAIYFKNDFIDTWRIARKLLKKLDHYRLLDLANHYDIDNDQAHRALNDVETTSQVYLALKQEVESKYESHQEFINLFKTSSSKIKAKDVVPESFDFDEDHILFNQECVITGKLEKMTRKEAMQIISNIGGKNRDSVTKKTRYLILGDYSDCRNVKGGKTGKLKKAEAYMLTGQEIDILSEEAFYDLITFEN